MNAFSARYYYGRNWNIGYFGGKSQESGVRTEDVGLKTKDVGRRTIRGEYCRFWQQLVLRKLLKNKKAPD